MESVAHETQAVDFPLGNWLVLVVVFLWTCCDLLLFQTGMDSMVTLILHNRPHRGKMFCYEPTMITIVGKLVPNPYWVGEDCVTIDTGESFNPLRIVKKEDVAFGLNVRLPKKARPKFWSVIGSKGDQYVVINDEGTWTCTCKGFEFHEDCKHIRAKKEEVYNPRKHKNK